MMVIIKLATMGRLTVYIRQVKHSLIHTYLHFHLFHTYLHFHLFHTYLHFHLFITALLLLRSHLDRSRMARDLLDGAHEYICDDGNTEKAPEQSNKVDEGTGPMGPRVLVDQRQKQTLF